MITDWAHYYTPCSQNFSQSCCYRKLTAPPDHSSIRQCCGIVGKKKKWRCFTEALRNIKYLDTVQAYFCVALWPGWNYFCLPNFTVFPWIEQHHIKWSYFLNILCITIVCSAWTVKKAYVRFLFVTYFYPNMYYIPRDFSWISGSEQTLTVRCLPISWKLKLFTAGSLSETITQRLWEVTFSILVAVTTLCTAVC